MKPKTAIFLFGRSQPRWFHVWCSIDEDVQLVELVQQTFADIPCRFMIDLEGAYDLEDALRLVSFVEPVIPYANFTPNKLLQSEFSRRKLA